MRRMTLEGGSGDDSDGKGGFRIRRNNGQANASVYEKARIYSWVIDIVATIFVILGLFLVWVGWYSNIQAHRAQDHVAEQMEKSWGEPVPAGKDSLSDAVAVASGDGIGYLHVPALGENWAQAVVKGTDQSALAQGPGYYTGSQAPGARGNFAVAGHRDGTGAPFHDLDRLDTCDPVVVQTRDHWFIYRVLPVDWANGDGSGYRKAASECMDTSVTSRLDSSQYAGLPGRLITDPGDVDQVAPVPRHAELAADDAQLNMLTLTTCHPIWSNKQRLVIHAVLTETFSKASEPAGWTPEALTE